jgi:hypothetical protein
MPMDEGLPVFLSEAASHIPYEKINEKAATQIILFPMFLPLMIASNCGM